MAEVNCMRLESALPNNLEKGCSGKQKINDSGNPKDDPTGENKWMLHVPRWTLNTSVKKIT